MTFDPDDGFAGPASFAYTVDDQQGHTVAGAVTDRGAAAVQPAARRRRTRRSPSRPARPTNIDLAALVTDPDPDDTLTFTIERAGRGRRRRSPPTAPTVRPSAPIDAAPTRTDSFHVHRHRRRRGVGDGAPCRSPSRPPAAPPPQAQADAATTNQGQAVTVAVLGNDIDPLGRGLTVTSRRRRRRPARRRPTASSVTFTPNADFFGAGVVHLPRPRRRQHGRAASPRPRSTVTVIGQPSAPGTPVGTRGQRARPTVNWAAPPSNGAPIDDYELRIDGGESPRRSARRPATRGTG